MGRELPFWAEKIKGDRAEGSTKKHIALMGRSWG